MQTDIVAIIGAGPAGLATARALKALSIPFVIFERHKNVGGIWDIQNPGSPMYDSAHFISSKTMSGHIGFPMPAHYPDYPSNRQILAYIDSFAEAFGLKDQIEFEAQVLNVSQQHNLWEVEYEQHGEKRVRQAKWVVAANGTNWFKNQPRLKGQETFTGEVIHSVEYSDPASLKGQRVLVVGAGNSGVDIACDAAFNAKEAYTSMRRGYHFVPKHIFGMPADVFGAQSDWMPMRLQQVIFGGLLRALNGDLSRLGLKKPDHKVLSSHPILNSQLLHYLQHGDIQAMPDIDHLDGHVVHFSDGRQIEVDKIILATGYDWKLPYLDSALFEWESERPKAFMKIFNPKHPTLFLNGFIETNGGAYKLFDDMAYLIARSIEAQRHNVELASKVSDFINGPEPDLSGQLHYVDSARHQGYTNSKAFNKAIALMRDKMGWAVPDATFYRSIKNDDRIEIASLTETVNRSTDQPAPIKEAV